MDRDRLNALGKAGIPFFFFISYDKSESLIHELHTLPEQIRYSFYRDVSNSPTVSLKPAPMDSKSYKDRFSQVIEEIKSGNTYLLNLTCETPLKNNDLDLEMIFENADAAFKCLVKDRFVCFSPERFVKIERDRISTYPMKGTVDAAILDAESAILNDSKEMAEHVMVVDLLRNDLSIVAKNVAVRRFRYVDEISAGNRRLLQVSSEITGNLESGWQGRIGDILERLLPAGSVTGAPKRSTCRIIERVEGYNRGFYTGVFGVFDGQNLDSAVAIRFIEKKDNGYVYKSGGGITIDSDCLLEYREMIQKIYVPVL